MYNVQCNWSLAPLAEYFGKYRYIQLGDSLTYCAIASLLILIVRSRMFISDGQIANLPVGQVLLALQQLAIRRYLTY